MAIKYVCPDCGSSNVLQPTWVYANKENNNIIVGDRVEGVDFDLCEDCDAQEFIIEENN